MACYTKELILYCFSNNVENACTVNPCGHFFYVPGTLSAFSHGAKMASTPSTLSTMLKISILYILQYFYKPSTIFYKMPNLLKPSTKYFIFYRISTIVETLYFNKLLIIRVFLLL